MACHNQPVLLAGKPERERQGLAWGAVGQPGWADGPAEDWADSMVQALLPVTEEGVQGREGGQEGRAAAMQQNK